MGHPQYREIDGRAEAWLVLPFPEGLLGGWVCNEPDDTQAGGFCGLPVESEPCTKHHPAPPEPLVDAVYEVLFAAVGEHRLIHCAITGQYPPADVHGLESADVRDIAERIARAVAAAKVASA